MKTKTKRKVFLAFEAFDGFERRLVAVYAKGSYRAAYNWLAELAERDGNALHQMGLKYPTVGHGSTIAEVQSPATGEHRWLEEHEVV